MKNVFAMNIRRELALPFVKSTRASKTKWAASFVDRLTDQIHKIVHNDKKRGLLLSAQFAFVANGALLRNDPHNLRTSLAHRDITSFITTDIFYWDSVYSAAKQIASDWQQENTRLFVHDALFDQNGDDLRMTWATFGDVNLSHAYRYYYNADNDYANYRRLRAIKSKVDAKNLLSNEFTVKPVDYDYSTEEENAKRYGESKANEQCYAESAQCGCSEVKHVMSKKKGKKVLCSKYKVTHNCIGDEEEEKLNSLILAIPHSYCPVDITDLQNAIISIQPEVAWTVYRDEGQIGIELHDIGEYFNALSWNTWSFEICFNEMITAGPGTVTYRLENDDVYSCSVMDRAIPHFCNMYDLNTIAGPKLDKQMFDDYYVVIDDSKYGFVFSALLDDELVVANVAMIACIAVFLLVCCVCAKCLNQGRQTNFSAFSSQDCWLTNFCCCCWICCFLCEFVKRQLLVYQRQFEKSKI